MTTRIIGETPGQRNRRLFVAAVAAGCSVQSEADGEYTVNSKSDPRKLYIVTLDSDEGQNIIHCTCDWAERKGWMRNDGKAPLCSHMNIVRFHLLDYADKLAIIEVAPDIRAALAGFGAELVAA
jgi:hypothetical protein